MQTNDIPGTQPNVMRETIQTKRIINPLAPQYQLSKVEERSPTPPKFIRDSMRTDVKDF